VRRQTGTRGIEAPPALEAPEALVAHAQPRYPRAASARVARLEVEEPFEDGGCTSPVGLALSAVEQDHARRSRADLVSRALRSSPVSARLRGPRLGTSIGSRLDLTLRSSSRRR